MENILRSLELINHKMASDICAKDAKILSSTPESFVKSNLEVWYVLTNVWLLLIEESSHRTRILVQEGILRHGLIHMIKEGDRIAECIMHSHSDGAEAVDFGGFFTYLPADIAESADAEREILTILRFAKRLSPAKADKVTQDSLNKFEAVNAKNHQQYLHADCPTCNQNPVITKQGIEVTTINKVGRLIPDYDLEHYSSLWRDIRREFRQLTKHLTKEICKEWCNLAVGISNDTNRDFFDNCMLSSGSTYEHAQTVSEKLKCLANHYPSLVLDDMSYPFFGYPQCETEYVSRDLNELVFVRKAQKYKGKMTHFVPRRTRGERREVYLVTKFGPNGRTRTVPVKLPNTCRVVAVPKSFKAARIIAMEQTWRGYLLQGLRHFLVSGTRKSPDINYINVEDQGPNQDWAWQGSIDRQICTQDLTSASDSITDVQLYDLMPELADFWDEIRSKYLDMPDGRRIKAYIALTSGTPVTFIIESYFFLAVARAVTNYVQVFEEDELHQPRTFGDDLEIDARCFDTLIDVLSSLGFTVNVSKSFGPDTNYRESCGVEYLNGYPLHTVKWPRTCFSMTANSCDPESLSSLVSLQHKIYDLSFEAQKFVAAVVEQKLPSITSSTPYQECDDLWSHDPRFQTRVAPHKGELPPVTGAEPWAREGHSTMIGTTKVKQAFGVVSQNVDMYNYVHFLKYGPTYDDALSELLHVSTASARDEQFAKPSNTWRTVTR